MTSILKVDTIQDADGNNIINESSNTITVGASGDTTNIIWNFNVMELLLVDYWKINSNSASDRCKFFK